MGCEQVEEQRKCETGEDQKHGAGSASLPISRITKLETKIRSTLIFAPAFGQGGVAALTRVTHNTSATRVARIAAAANQVEQLRQQLQVHHAIARMGSNDGYRLPPLTYSCYCIDRRAGRPSRATRISPTSQILFRRFYPESLTSVYRWYARLIAHCS